MPAQHKNIVLLPTSDARSETYLCVSP